MTGLLLKDFYTLRQYGKSLLLVLVFFSLLSLGMDNPAMFFEGFFVLMSMMMTIYSFSYDMLAKWDRYALSLPVTKKDIVMSKYLLSVILGLGGTILSFALTFVILKIKPVDDFTFSDHLTATAAILGIALLFISIILPMIFKFGVEKSRILLVIVFALPSAAFIVVGQLGLTLPSEADFQSFIKIMPVGTIVIFVLSYFLSLSIFSRKEF